MAKQGKGRVMVSCVCPVCGQQSKAQAGTTHFGCVGVAPEVFEKFPRLRGRFSRPAGKGTWQAV